ncbi:MAG: zinc-binding dehydrogenase [Meiothermus sp.]|nr:zinc-binding dehydrogenase [Meiothermus sp.]
MNAIVVRQHGGPEVLEWLETPDPVPGAGEVLVRTTLTGLNFADLQSRRGGYDAGGALPFTPGLDVVGIVEAVGEGVSLPIGQRVVAFAAAGSYAEKVLAKAVLTYPIPDALSDEQVSGLTALVTAYNLLHWAARVQRGETVLIHAAAGGVGGLAVQMAKAFGARVMGTAGTEDKLEYIRSLGADHAFTYEGFPQKVLQVAKAGADVILDSLSGETFNLGLTCLAPFGRMVVYGHAGGEAGTFDTRPLHRQTKAVIGYSSGHYRRSRPELLRPTVEAVFGLLERGEVRLEVGARFKLSEAAQAHALMENRQSRGKLLLYP